MPAIPSDCVVQIEEALKQERGVGTQRFGVTKIWFDTFVSKKDAAPTPQMASANDKSESVVWLNNEAVKLLEEWYGAAFASSAKESLKGLVVYVDDKGKEEVETVPTYAVIEIRTEEGEKVAVSRLDNISAGEGIPNLVRRALDSIPSLSTIDEEDVRLWIRKSGDANFQLCSSDEAKEGVSDPEEDLPEEFEETSDNSSTKAVPTLRTVLGPLPPQQTIHFLLETRTNEGKFPRKSHRLIAPVVTPRSVKIPFGLDQARPVSKSFSQISGPQVGQSCDAQRTVDDRWLEAKITQVLNDQITVHFLSFPSKADESFPVNSPRIQPPHSKTPDWREQLKVGEEIDIHYSSIAPRLGGRLYNTWREKSGSAAWATGTVKKVERNVSDPRIMVAVRFGRFGSDSTVWVQMYSEKIAKRFTHIARPKSEHFGPQSSQGAPPAPGIVGLRNLGNTCYMNSMLQCLSHCNALREHFISGEFQKDINRKNPLGMGGQLAEAFADVVTKLWSSEFQVVAPTKFKQILGQMNMQFQGYQQHDSQELLTLLADGLHEDLNRIKAKQPTAAIDSNGRPDDVVAKESWETFLRRNDSKIIDEMYGLLKSHLVCPVCKKEAVKFDAYSNVSVPLPSLTLTKVRLLFINPSFEASRCLAMLPRRATGRAIAEWIASRQNVSNVDDIIVAELLHNKASIVFHRALVSGGAISDDAETSERKAVRDVRETSIIVAWQLPSHKQVLSQPRGDSASAAVFEANWSNFFKDVNQICLQAPTLVPEQIAARVKELFSLKFTTSLSGPFPIAQRRLVKGLAAIKDSDVTQLLAREAIRMVESESAFNCPVEADLLKEAGQQEDDGANSNSIGTTQSSSTLGSSNGLVNGVQSKKSASPFRAPAAIIMKASRMFASKEAANGQSSANGSPLIPTRTITPPAANGQALHNPQQPGQLPLPTVALNIDKDARLAVEIRHVRPKPARTYRQRAPVFIGILADRTCEDLRRLINDYIKDNVLAGFVPDVDQNAIPSAAAGAAKLELNSHEESSSVKRTNGSAIDYVKHQSSYYSLELDMFENIHLPCGPVPILEALCYRSSPNALVVHIKWADVPAAEYAFRSIDQEEGNPEKIVDSELGLGKVKIDESCLEKQDLDEKAVSLQQCLDVFRQKEQLGEDDPWYCDQCKTHRCAFKTMDLWNTPNILVIHLKRFLYERVGGVLGERVQREKINDLVKFPMSGFDIGPMLAGKNHSKLSTTYDLFAVSNHMGGLGGGHYTAFVKANDGSWWLMNDGVCSKVDPKNEESEVVSSNAYVLFYKRRQQ